MKSVVFGSPETDSWKLTRQATCRREKVVEISGQLQVGFFSAVTPACIPPASLRAFAAELESVDRTLTGSATLESSNQQSQLSWTLKALPLGHIESTGRYAINGDQLLFSFRTDQTQLAPLLKWLRSAVAAYEQSNDA